MRAKITTLFAVVAAILIILFSGSADSKPKSNLDKCTLIPVGLASVDITPSEPIRLSGYRVRSKPTNETAQKLRANAIAFGEKDSPALLLTVDLVGITRTITDRLAERLEKAETGVTRERLAVCVTHTHSGPFVKGNLPHIFGKPIPTAHQEAIDRYAVELEEKLLEVSLAALRDRSPARLSWSRGKATFAANRRVGYLRKSFKKTGPIPAPTDHDLPVLFVHSPNNGSLRAVLTSYACHCTTLSGGGFNQFHGDWAGEAARLIEKQNPGTLALIAIGCGADQNPKPRGSLENVATHGKEIVDEVQRLLRKGEKNHLKAAPHCRYESVNLPFAKLPDEAELKRRLASKTERIRYYAQILSDRRKNGIDPPPFLEYPIQTWNFGNDLTMVFLPGEVTVDYGLRLKRELDAARLWVNAYSNDVPCYIASARVIAEGGYEVDASMDSYDKPARFDPAVEDIIIRKVLQLAPKTFHENPE